jgi:hypothetical protein
MYYWTEMMGIELKFLMIFYNFVSEDAFGIKGKIRAHIANR